MGRLKKQIWGELASVTPANVHALILMLIAAKMIELFIPKSHLIGKDALRLKDASLRLAKHTATKDDGDYADFVINDPAQWKSFNTKEIP